MRWPALVVPLVGALGLVGACGDDGGPDAGAVRADQARQAALDAGLDTDVAELLALATTAVDATYSLTYEADGGGTITVTQRPPDRRVEVEDADGTVDITITSAETTHVCTDPAGDEPAVCDDVGRTPPTGVFDDDAVAAFTAALLDGADDFDIAVDEREVAGTQARCLVTTGTGVTGTLCLADGTGAVLLVERAGGTLRASRYATSVDDRAFELPAGTG